VVPAGPPAPAQALDGGRSLGEAGGRLLTAGRSAGRGRRKWCRGGCGAGVVSGES
jgi:hypothetical protein